MIAEAFGEKAVERAPDDAGGQRGRRQHEVARARMRQSVEQGGRGEAGVRVPAFRQGALHVAAPINLFGGTDEQKHQRGEQPRRFAFFHAVDGVHLRTREVEHPGRRLVAEPENAPQRGGDRRAERDVGNAPADSPQTAAVERDGKDAERDGRGGHHPPKVDVRRRQRREHRRPQREGERQREQELFHDMIPLMMKLANSDRLNIS